jgi:hypothetical protein
VSTPPMPTPERLGPEGTAGPRPDRARAGPFPPRAVIGEPPGPEDARSRRFVLRQYRRAIEYA